MRPVPMGILLGVAFSGVWVGATAIAGAIRRRGGSQRQVGVALACALLVTVPVIVIVALSSGDDTTVLTAFTATSFLLAWLLPLVARLLRRGARQASSAEPPTTEQVSAARRSERWIGVSMISMALCAPLLIVLSWPLAVLLIVGAAGLEGPRRRMRRIAQGSPPG